MVLAQACWHGEPPTRADQPTQRRSAARSSQEAEGMLDDTNAQYDTDIGQQLAQGTPVYDVNSDKVGTVADTYQQNNAMIIQKGLFFPKDISVPMSCIARSDADGVYLNISKDDVSNGNFNAAGSQWNRTGTAVDTETPYQAGPARSVGDQPLGDRAAATADQLGN